MAFDLVEYFVEQIETQKPTLLDHFSRVERRELIRELNALSLGKLITQWRQNSKKVYQEIQNPDELYVQEIARHLTTTSENQSQLDKPKQIHAISEIFKLQLLELKQLNETANLNHQGIHELLLGQIKYLSGQADDWVWSTNKLIELKGSKPVLEETVSLQVTMKEFNSMVNQHHDTHEVATENVVAVPTWSKLVEPLVAIVILWVLAYAGCAMFA
jgi:hypothetical protein